jgi:dihydroflavonol-4-reductase
MKKRWAVTGATGLLGNNLVRHLVARGAEVTVLARGANRRELAGLDVRVVQGDLDDSAALAECFRGAEVVVHAAALVTIAFGERSAMERVNVEGTRAVCAAVPAGARLVHVSSVDGLGMRTREHPADEDCEPKPEEGGVPYVDTKRAADQVVRASGLDHVIVHPAFMVGPWDWKPSSGRMILAIARGLGRFPPGGGNNFVHVRDVCEGVVAASEARSGGAWILGNENLDYREAWTRIAAVTGGPRPLATIPRFAGRVAERALSLGAALGLREGDVNAATTRMAFAPHYFDPSRARRELGLAATPVDEAFREAWEWFGEYGFR